MKNNAVHLPFLIPVGHIASYYSFWGYQWSSWYGFYPSIIFPIFLSHCQPYYRLLTTTPLLSMTSVPGLNGSLLWGTVLYFGIDPSITPYLLLFLELWVIITFIIPFPHLHLPVLYLHTALIGRQLNYVDLFLLPTHFVLEYFLPINFKNYLKNEYLLIILAF